MFFGSMSPKTNQIDNSSKDINILIATNCLLDFSMKSVQNF